MKRLAATLLGTWLLLAGCASLPAGPQCARLGTGAAACLLPPAAWPAIEVQRVVTLRRAGTSQSFLGDLHVDAGGVRLVAASLFGTPLFTLGWDGVDVSAVPADRVRRPRLLLVALMLALVTDPAQLRPALHGATLEVTHQAGIETRILRAGRRVLLQVERPLQRARTGRITLRVPAARLVLQLDPVEEP